MDAKKLSIPKNLVYREIDDELVLLNLETSEYYSLNHTGAVIWKALEKGKKTDAIASDLSREFKIDRETADSDLEAFLRAVTKLGLVKYEKK
ncbi:MAG: PqqD family protein [Elusimicrobia bacterium CG08_land_8_20_14_0_20_51_18]|nr:MAG: PqqD family protein [Elusimicrobia bacterium CG08_land_8_20_14_0_20_51_18]